MKPYLLLATSIGLLSLEVMQISAKPLTSMKNKGKAIHISKSKEVWMTVFIHGIMSIKPHINIENLIRICCDQLDNSTYAKTVDIIRKNSFFFTNQAMQEYGLKCIDMDTQEVVHGAQALAIIFDMFIKHLPSLSSQNYFYTFGWSGLISDSVRKKAGQKLYSDIANELESFKKIGIKPKLRIIGYSHGGNVALNIALQQQNHFAVDELILIGTPIQCENDYLITSPLFKKVINIFSTADRIQRLDFFSSKRFFSNQTFKTRKNLILPPNLIQVQIKTTTTIKGYEFANSDLQELSKPSLSFISGQAPFLRERSPGHAELWFFGGTSKNYRRNYPLYPLPTAAIIPYILQGLSNYQFESNPKDIIVADIRPEYQSIILRNKNNCSHYCIMPFLSTATIRDLNSILQRYTPKEHSRQEYNKQICKAFLKAKESSKKAN